MTEDRGGNNHRSVAMLVLAPPQHHAIDATDAAHPLPERAGRLAQHNKDASRAVR